MSETFSSEFKETVAFYAVTAWDGIVRAAKWYWKRYARETLCFLCGFLLAIIVLRSGQTKQMTETAVAETVTVQETQRTATEGQKTTLYRNVARALYGIRQYNLSPDAKRAYIQVMLNRANPEIQYDVMKGTDDLASVLAVPKQWQGYNPEGNYTEEDFQLVKEFLESGSGNVLNNDRYFWVEVRQGYIICKTDINGSGKNYKEQVVQ
jgi:hypothetical protein